MDIPWRPALLVVAAAFVVFLLAKLIPGGARRIRASAPLREARARLRAAKDDRERAEALCAAAEVLIASPFGGARGAAYFMRAMRADPAWPGAVQRAAAALAPRRARLLHRMMWRRLAALPWDAAHRPVLLAIAEALLATSKRPRARSPQVEVIARLAAGERLDLTGGG